MSKRVRSWKKDPGGMTCTLTGQWVCLGGGMLQEMPRIQYPCIRACPFDVVVSICPRRLGRKGSPGGITCMPLGRCWKGTSEFSMFVWGFWN